MGFSKGKITFVDAKIRCGTVTSDDSKNYEFSESNIDKDFLDLLIEKNPSRESGVPVIFFPSEYYEHGKPKPIAELIKTPNWVKGDKPSLDLEQQINHMKKQGITFELVSEEDAVKYLRDKNNYFRTRSYRTGFNKTPLIEGGYRFDRLDFGMLSDLAEIDSLLRSTMLDIVLDIERIEKLCLLEYYTLEGEDSYEIPKAYLSDQANYKNGLKIDKLEETRSKDVYARGLIQRYSSTGYPLWAFLELITFGDLIHLCKFCINNYDYSMTWRETKELMFVKDLRNACAHNSCILNEISPQSRDGFTTPVDVGKMLAQIKTIGRDQRQKNMENRRIQQIVTTLFVHSNLVDDELFEKRKSELGGFFERATLHSDYYEGNNDTVFNALVFLRTVYEYLY